jgi:hypothetical protein
MRRFVFAALLAAAVPAAAHEGHEHGQEAKPAEAKADALTVTGEVLDLSCYLGHGAKGKPHQKCAKACLLDKKVPAGLLLDDGSVLLLVPDHKHEKAFKPVGELAAERVTVRGRKVVSGGLPGLMVETVEKAGK